MRNKDLSAKTLEQLEAEQEDILADLDYAYERAFTTASWVRSCPGCDAGWVIYEENVELQGMDLYKNPVTFSTECFCFLEHKKSVRAMRLVREAYRKKYGAEPPEPDRKRLQLW